MLQEHLETAALPTKHEHELMQPALTSLIEVITVSVQQCRLQCSMKDRIACARVLVGVDLVGLLLNSIVANSHARQECRYSAAACLREISLLCALLRSALPAFQSQPPGNASSTEEQDCRSVLQDLTPSLCLLLQHLVRQVGMPAQKTHDTTVVGRNMLRLSLSILRAICQAVPCEQWALCVPVICATAIHNAIRSCEHAVSYKSCRRSIHIWG